MTMAGGWPLLLPSPLWRSDFKEKEQLWPFKGVVRLNLEMSGDSLDTHSHPHSDENSAKQSKSKQLLYLGACFEM